MHTENENEDDGFELESLESPSPFPNDINFSEITESE